MFCVGTAVDVSLTSEVCIAVTWQFLQISFVRCRPYFLGALGAGGLVFWGLEIAKTLLGSRKGFFRIQRVGWVLGAQVLGSGVLGAQVLGANSGVLVFKLWGLCPKCAHQRPKTGPPSSRIWLRVREHSCHHVEQPGISQMAENGLWAWSESAESWLGMNLWLCTGSNLYIWNEVVTGLCTATPWTLGMNQGSYDPISPPCIKNNNKFCLEAELNLREAWSMSSRFLIQLHSLSPTTIQ